MKVIERIQEHLESLYARLDRRSGGRLSLLVKTALAFDQDDGPIVARSMAYYALFAIFPALLALIVVASSVLDSAQVQDTVTDFVTQYMPIALEFVEDNIKQMLAMRETVGLVALVGLIWSASGVFSAAFRAVNKAWGVPKSKLFFSQKLYGLTIVLIVGVLFVATTAFSAGLSIMREWNLSILGWQPFSEPGSRRLVTWLGTLVPAVMAALAFMLMYRTMPQTKVKWREVWLGGLIAGLVWEVGKQLYAWYLANFATNNVVYGSVGAIIGFLLWAYLSAQIFLVGAQFTVVQTDWRRAGCPIETRPLGEWMADWSPQKSAEEHE
jgi:membrane protein